MGNATISRPDIKWTRLYGGHLVSNANTDTFNIATFSTCITVTPSFFVGFIITTQGNQFPVGFDESNPLSGRSYVAANGAGMGDIMNLTSNTLVPLDAVENYGLMGNFMIRADACVPEPATTTLLAGAGIAGLFGYRTNARRRRMNQAPSNSVS